MAKHANRKCAMHNIAEASCCSCRNQQNDACSFPNFHNSQDNTGLRLAASIELCGQPPPSLQRLGVGDGQPTEVWQPGDDIFVEPRLGGLGQLRSAALLHRSNPTLDRGGLGLKGRRDEGVQLGANKLFDRGGAPAERHICALARQLREELLPEPGFACNTTTGRALPEPDAASSW